MRQNHVEAALTADLRGTISLSGIEKARHRPSDMEEQRHCLDDIEKHRHSLSGKENKGRVDARRTLGSPKSFMVGVCNFASF